MAWRVTLLAIVAMVLACSGEETLAEGLSVGMRIQWAADVGSPVLSTPLLSNAGDVLVGTSSGSLVALSGPTGNPTSSAGSASALMLASPLRSGQRLYLLLYSGKIISVPDPSHRPNPLHSGPASIDARTEARIPRLRVRTDWHDGLKINHEMDFSHPDVTPTMTPSDISENIGELSAAGIKVVSRGLKGNSADHPLRQSHQHNDKQQQAESTADTANFQAKATHDEKEQQQQHEHGQEQQQTEHDQQNGRAQHNGGTREEPNEQQNEQQGEAHGQKDAHHEKEKVQKPDEQTGQHEVNMNQKEDGKQHDGHHMEGNARADGYLTSQNQEHNDGDIKHEHQRKLMQVKDDDSAEKNEQSDDFDFDHLPDDELDAAHDLDDDLEHGGFDLNDMSDLSDERLFDLDEFDDGSNALFEDDIFPFLFDDDDDSMSIEDLWLNEIGGDEEQEEHDIVNNRIGVDPHVLANGAIGDIDGDGVDDLVVPVSYFFDEDYYQKPENRRKLRGVDPQLFLATGVVVYTHDQIFNDWTIKWKAHLDLTTANASRKAYALSPPTLADLDGDGMLEIVVGTSVGFVYALNPSDGSTMEHYPLQLGEVQAQVTVEDMDDDGSLDLVVCDMDGVVAAFTGDSGSKLWERHMGSPIAQAASIGDVTGSGKLDVVVSTTAGGVHILNGGSGTSVFHTRTAGSIVSPPLLTQLNSSSSGLHVVVPSFDGFVYAFDGTNSSKRDVVDLGERSLAMPLTHDLDGDGLLDIVVATMSGTVFSIETLVRTSPLMSVKSQAPEGVPLVARPNWRGLYALTTQSRGWRDIFGKRAAFPFTIVDRSKTKQTVNFTVSAFMMSNEDGASGQMVRSYSTSGRKIAVVDVPPVRGAGSLELRMKDAAGRRFSDSLDVTFHTSHYRILKWIVTAAMGLGMLGIFHATREQGGESLPG